MSNGTPRGRDVRWVSPFGDRSRQAFKKRVMEEGEQNWKYFVHLRDLLIEVFDVERWEAWTDASQFFPVGSVEYGIADYQRFKSELILRHSRKLALVCDNDGTLIRAEGDISAAAQEAIRSLPEGKGDVTGDDINWAMNRSALDMIDVVTAPNQRVVGLWLSVRRDPEKFERTWASKLLNTKDPEADQKREAADERSEADDHAANCEELQELIGGLG